MPAQFWTSGTTGPGKSFTMSDDLRMRRALSHRASKGRAFADARSLYIDLHPGIWATQNAEAAAALAGTKVYHPTRRGIAADLDMITA